MAKTNPKSVKDMKESPYNPRNITPDQLKMLGKSMREFGDLSGVVVNIRTGNTVGGHQRIKHLDPKWNITKNKHKDKVGTVTIGYIDTPFGRWNYREVDWPLKREKQANVSANKQGGEFDLLRLKDVILELEKTDTDLLGFDRDELDYIKNYTAFDDSFVPEALADPPVTGDDTRSNMFVIVFNGDKERKFILKTLNLPDNFPQQRLRITVDEIKKTKKTKR